MTQLYNSISQFITKILNSLANTVTQSEQALQTQFKIKPIKKENLGILNGLILASGIITSILLTNSKPGDNPISISVELIIICLIFVISILFTTNHYIHTIITLFAAFNLYNWLGFVSTYWTPLIYALVLLIIMLFVTYFDLLKKNLVLQLTNLTLLFSFLNIDFLSRYPVQTFLDYDNPMINPSNNQEFKNLLTQFVLSQIIILPIFYFIIKLSKRTHRIALSKILSIIFHIACISIVIALVFLLPANIVLFFLLLVLIISLILNLNNYHTLGFAYLIIFLLSSIYLILNNKIAGDSISYSTILIIFPIITLLTIISKYFIDKGSN